MFVRVLEIHRLNRVDYLDELSSNAYGQQHTDNEHVKVADLHRAVEDYAMLAKHLLAS